MLAPWLVRNVLISGWLIYPFAAIDLFSVDWKIPASYLQNDSDQIKVWGRCLYDVTKINDPVSAWFPVWWGEKDRYEMMLLIANMVAGISAVLSVVWKRIRKEKLCWDRVVVYAAVLGGIAGWFFLAPFIRYGLAFLLIFSVNGIWRMAASDADGAGADCVRFSLRSALFQFEYVLGLLCVV